MHAIACANDRINRNWNPSRKEIEMYQGRTVMTGKCAMGDDNNGRQNRCFVYRGKARAQGNWSPLIGVNDGDNFSLEINHYEGRTRSGISGRCLKVATDLVLQRTSINLIHFRLVMAGAEA